MNQRHSKAMCFLMLFVMLAAVVILIFWTEWDMGKDCYRENVIAAMKSGDTHAASLALLQWSKADSKGSKVDPVYLDALVNIHQKNGNKEAAQYNLDRLNALKQGK